MTIIHIREISGKISAKFTLGRAERNLVINQGGGSRRQQAAQQIIIAASVLARDGACHGAPYFSARVCQILLLLAAVRRDMLEKRKKKKKTRPRGHSFGAAIRVYNSCSSSPPIVYLAVSWGTMANNDSARARSNRSCNHNFATVNHDRCLRL